MNVTTRRLQCNIQKREARMLGSRSWTLHSMQLRSACVLTPKDLFVSKKAHNVLTRASEVDNEAPSSPAEPAQLSAPLAVSVDSIKSALLDLICGTERGAVARSEVRAEINELVNQLEVAGGPHADVSSASLGGTWELLYCNAPQLVALLGLNRLPLLPLRVGPVTQRIQPASSTLENCVQLQFPMLQTSLSTLSSYTVASPKRLQFTIQSGRLHTPSIEASLELPATLSLMGQTLDLSPLREALAPLTRGAEGLAASASDLLGQAPALEVPLEGLQAAAGEGWQLTTYLDEEMRITRGDGGTVYVFRKCA
ncbi:hypothetical protein Agub_g1319 [Astrephomene gubernaculifera]|uniref:Plastid lipid-associated protein/fibrillin conserved domain-containing protein n=1 Tax=Astrephomene gubernaculifera TaxID=47775 RepID=A0AAD3DH86_9CHLO|nr:hypothetical protein Agub_g1319 [Astrephomene gubernaculifera]